MSDSSIALKPVIDDPSKPMPSFRAPSISAGVIAHDLRWPSMSLNQKRTYSIPSFSICFNTSFRAPGSEVARSLLSIIAIARCSFVAGLGTDRRLFVRQGTLVGDHSGGVEVAEAPVQGLHCLIALLRPGA